MIIVGFIIFYFTKLISALAISGKIGLVLSAFLPSLIPIFFALFFIIQADENKMQIFNYKIYLFFIIFLFIQPLYAQQSFYLSADKIIKNDKKKIIFAKGNVEIQSGKIKTKSDLLEFDIQKNQITLEGNIKILNAQGDIVFAEKAILDKKLKEGIIKKARSIDV